MEQESVNQSGVQDQEQAQAKLDQHFLDCYTKFPYYAGHNLKIQTQEGELKNFELNEVQQILEDIILDIQNAGRLIRVYILKARREGVSTWSTGRFFWKVSNKRNKYAVIVTHESPATQFLFDMQRRYYKHLEPELKPVTKRNNARMLHFDNDEGSGLDSAISVGTAGVKDFGSGQMINYLHISELGKWPRENEEDLLISLFQCVPREADSTIIIESTAKGTSGEFYKGYWSSRFIYEVYLDGNEVKWRVTINEKADPSNIYSSIFIPWFVFKRYKIKAPANFKRTAEEELWAKRYGLDNDQLNWYRSILANECKGDKKKRDQEYPMTAKSAFIGSGTPAFDIEQVMELAENAVESKRRTNFVQSSKVFVNHDEGHLKIWQEPVAGTPYLISADVAEGLSHGDFDSATVWNHMTTEEVAKFHGKLSPFKFAYLLESLGYMYNTAWLVPERNNHGISVIEKLLELEYPNIYVEMIPDPPHKTRRRFGWVTSSKSRVLMIDTLIEDVNNGVHYIKDKGTFEEMLNFKVQNDGKIEADEGCYDDKVMDVAIGRYTLKTMPYALAFNRNMIGGGYAHNSSNVLVQPAIPDGAWN